MKGKEIAGFDTADAVEDRPTATFLPTKAGRGFKIVVNGTWMYVSKRKLLAVVRGQRASCVFNGVVDDDEE